VTTSGDWAEKFAGFKKETPPGFWYEDTRDITDQLSRQLQQHKNAPLIMTEGAIDATLFLNLDPLLQLLAPLAVLSFLAVNDKVCRTSLVSSR